MLICGMEKQNIIHGMHKFKNMKKQELVNLIETIVRKQLNESYNALTNYIFKGNSDFENVHVRTDGGNKYHLHRGDPKYLRVDIEPYNKEITDAYYNRIVKLLKNNKTKILSKFPGTEFIDINDKITI